MSRILIQSDVEPASKPKVNSGITKRFTLRLGKITAVYPENNNVDIQWIFPNRGIMEKLELTKPYVGFQSGIHFIPQVGSLVTVGFAEDLPILLTYFTPSSFSNMLSGIKNNQGLKTRVRKLNEGEISINSIQNSEIYLHDKIEMYDGMLDSIVIDPIDGSITLESLQTYINNEAGNITMGMVKRNGEIITDDGQSVTSTDGGNALTELKITVNKLADNSINSSSVKNKAVAEITVGTLVDNSGKIVKDQTDTTIVCQIKFSSGAVVNINEKGQLNIDEGNMKKPSEGGSGTQQRAAREGDRITIPVVPGTTDTDHPQLDQKATANLTNFQQLAPMFLVYGIPATFIPTTPGTKIIGEITQGSNDVFIGSIDKSKESQETSKNQ